MKKPVIYDQDLHRPLAGGETLDPSAIPISSEEGNIATVGEDGLYVPSSNLDALPEASVSEAGVILLASAAEAQALSNADKAVTPSTLGAAMKSHVLGMGQTWKNMNGVRNFGTTYTNTTGRPIFVSVMTIDLNASAVHELALVVGAHIVCMYDVNIPSVPTFEWVMTVQGIVPDGSTYRVDHAGSLPDGYYWRELR